MPAARRILLVGTLALIPLLAVPPPAAADVPIGLVIPMVAGVGEEARVQLEEPCRGVAPGEIAVLLWPAIMADPAAEDVQVVPVRVEDGSYVFVVPPGPPGPYAVNVQCGTDRFGITNNGTGPLFYVRAELAPGALFDTYLFEACGDDRVAALGPDLAVLGAGVPNIADPADPRLVPVPVTQTAALAEEDIAVWARLRAPSGITGPLHLYTHCRDTFSFQGSLVDGVPLVVIVPAPDTSAGPPSRPGVVQLLLVAAAAGLVAGWRRAGRQRAA